MQDLNDPRVQGIIMDEHARTLLNENAGVPMNYIRGGLLLSSLVFAGVLNLDRAGLALFLSTITGVMPQDKGATIGDVVSKLLEDPTVQEKCNTAQKDIAALAYHLSPFREEGNTQG